MPADMLARLSRAELKARCEAAEQHHKTSSKTADQEASRYFARHARKVLHSLPVVEHIEELRRLASLMHDAGNRELWQAHRARRLEHEDANAYPSGLVQAVDDALLGRSSTPLANEIVAHACR